MGLFDKIFRPRTQYIPNNGYWQTLNAYLPQFTTWSGDIYDNELVRSAVHTKALHISKLSIDIQGTAQPRTHTALKNQPNDYMTWSQFLYRVSSIYDVYNNCIIVPIINKYGETIGVYPVLPANTTVVDVDGEPYLKYQFANGKTASMELSKCGIIKKHQMKDDIFGKGNMQPLKSTMELVDLQNQAIKEGVKSSATYRFMATVNNFSLDDDLVKERDSFVTKNMANDKKGGLILFPNTYSNIQQIQSKPYVIDAETTKQIAYNIYNYFGVSENLLQGRASEDELTSFYDCQIEPFAIQLSEVLTKMLYTRIEQSNNNRVIVTANRLQYMSTATKIQLASTLADRGVLTVGELRELFNYNRFGDQRDDMTLARGEYYNTIADIENIVQKEVISDDQGKS